MSTYDYALFSVLIGPKNPGATKYDPKRPLRGGGYPPPGGAKIRPKAPYVDPSRGANTPIFGGKSGPFLPKNQARIGPFFSIFLRTFGPFFEKRAEFPSKIRGCGLSKNGFLGFRGEKRGPK